METWPPLGPNLSSQISATVQSMQSSLEYAEEFRDDLTHNLAIPETYINNGEPHAAVLGYVKWLQESTSLGWFGFQVARIACIYGWAEIANKLNASSETKNNTLFYNDWIQPNLDWGYGTNMSRQFEEAIKLNKSSESFEVYSRLFRQGLRFEVAFFESAINKTLDSKA
ncbi:hypothetical protein F4823DRAFT_635946 [Ustulina deusta]|nr:hypothetical protein F4823DRAFT_635946 [Ustulina deusta]